MIILRKISEKINPIIKKILLNIMYGKKINIGKKFIVRKRVMFRISTGKIHIGNRVFFNNDCSINSLGYISIGDNCLFGENVKMYDHSHIFKSTTQNIIDQGMQIGSITIGNNCWIGSNVTILSNVKIGDNVVIGCNCVINRSIPDNVVVKNDYNLIIEERQDRR